MSAACLNDELVNHEIILAPDGDAAFDDGSHVLQFDQEGDQVRLIAFRNDWNSVVTVSAIADVKISADEFYGILDCWQKQFEVAWRAALDAKQPEN
jgi:hypothetical protein